MHMIIHCHVHVHWTDTLLLIGFILPEDKIQVFKLRIQYWQGKTEGRVSAVNYDLV